MRLRKSPTGSRFPLCTELWAGLRGGLAALAVLLVLVASSDARAQDDLSAEQIAEYEAHLQAGAEKFGAEDYQGARGELEAAYRIYPNPKILFSIAGTWRRQGDDEEAITAYQRFLDECNTEVCHVENEEQIRIAEETIETLQPRGLEPVVPPDGEGEKVMPKPPAQRSDGGERSRSVLFWTGVGIGVAGVAALGFAGVDQLRAAGLEGDIEDTLAANGNVWTAELDDKEEDGQSLRSRARILAVVGGVATVAGIGLIAYELLGSESQGGDAVAWSPMLSADGGGLVLSGRF